MTREHPEDPEADRAVEPGDAADAADASTSADAADSGPSPDGDHDAAWAAIVANYGDSVLGPVADSPAEAAATGDTSAAEPTAADAARLRRLFRPVDPRDADDAVDPDLDPFATADDDRFVPPTPPPVPRPTPDRLLAWGGVLGAPAALLVLVVLGIDLSQLVITGLVGWFLIGFGYLVATMPSAPRDPWDDGAQL
ncbi:hypothetical protein [Nocardioides sp.]|uniref:hypothetical protein n=1 Tax=Nocardioides sp. TaxID=35761 RepID=UPI0035138244